MIISIIKVATIIIGIFYAFAYDILYVLALLPTWTLPEAFTTALQSVSGFISALDTILPTVTIFAIMVLFILLEGSILTYKAFQWLIKKIPGIS